MKKIPQIRFPEFSGEWKEKRLGEVGNIKYGKGQNEIINKSEIYPIFGTGGILGKSGEYLYNKESVIIGRKGTIDKPIYVNGPFWCVDTTFFFEFHQNYTPKFIFYILNRINWKVYNESTGVPSLSSNTIKKIKIHIPPTIKEQQKIANFLSRIDDKIDIVSKKIEKLKEYKKGLMQKMLNVTNKGVPEVRFPEFSGEWGEKKFSDLFTTISTKPYQIKSNEILISGKYPVIDQGKTKIAGYSNENKKVLTNKGIIIFGDHTTILKYIDFNFIVGADGVKLIQNKDKNHHLQFLYYALLINNVKPEGYKRHFSILKQVKIHLPPTIEEQQKIAEFLSLIDKKIELNEQKLTKLKEYKKGLLQKMFV